VSSSTTTSASTRVRLHPGPTRSLRSRHAWSLASFSSGQAPTSSHSKIRSRSGRPFSCKAGHSEAIGRNLQSQKIEIGQAEEPSDDSSFMGASSARRPPGGVRSTTTSIHFAQNAPGSLPASSASTSPAWYAAKCSGPRRTKNSATPPGSLSMLSIVEGSIAATVKSFTSRNPPRQGLRKDPSASDSTFYRLLVEIAPTLDAGPT